MTIVKSTTESFRRAGIQFTRQGVDINFDALTDEQRAAIEAEPRLVINSDQDKPGKSKSKAKAGKDDDKAKSKTTSKS